MNALLDSARSFHFLWPQALCLLVAAPLLVWAYLWMLRRQRRHALRWPGIAQLREAQGPRRAWRRHLPPALFLGGLVLLGLACARPQARLTLPSDEQTLILAMDISASMGATDVEPTRLIAAQTAAKRLVSQLPQAVRVGIVSFAGTAALVQSPTRSRDEVNAAIDRFQLQPGTAIGSGIVVAMAALFPELQIDLGNILAGARALDEHGQDPAFRSSAEPGSYGSAAIVLLTDGQRTAGPDPLAAARLAADKGVRVYTVGVGTKEGKTISFQGWSVRVTLDEDMLRGIAGATRGEYFNASTADDLMSIYSRLQSRIVLRDRETEITALFAGAGALLALAAAGLSMLWYQRFL